MSAAAARLEVVAGNAIGTSLLVANELMIGRHADGPGRLADDQEISRSHARVTLESTGFLSIEDLGSTNGTFVNGLRITGPQTLSVGDTIELGSTTLVVREIPSVEQQLTPASGVRQATVVPDPNAPTDAAGSPPIAPPAYAGPPPAGFPGPPPPAFADPPPAFADPPPAFAPPAAPAFDEPVIPPASPIPPPPSFDEPAEPDSAPESPSVAAGSEALPPLTVGIEVDAAAGRARLLLADGSLVAELEHDGSAWRLAGG